MRTLLTAALAGAVAIIAAGHVLALDAGQAAPTVSHEKTGVINRIPLQPGANSFTEGQARDRIEDAGFVHVSELRLDSAGVWRGHAIKGIVPMNVGLDYKGNVAAER